VDDERLDDLDGKVDDLGRRMDLRFDSVARRFEALEVRFQRMQLVTITGFLLLAGPIVAQADYRPRSFTPVSACPAGRR
jgi:hypothetical protein